MNTQELTTISYLMKKQPLSATQAIRLILEALETLGKNIPSDDIVSTLRDCIRRGIHLQKQESTGINFNEAVERTLHSKRDRAPRTIQDFRQCMNTLMKRVPGLATTRLSNLTPEQCSRMLEESFHSPTRRRKAYACLSTLFRYGIRMGWAQENPVQNIDPPRVRERPILPLTPEEVSRLLRTAERTEHRLCLPPLGLMLYAGIRPYEVARLTWGDVDLDEGEITVPPRHSKTGGGRHIPICPALRQLLNRQHSPGRKQTICPPNWQNRWRALRRAAGFTNWQQDVLRHTFASYYAKAYRDLPSLQLYMGHRDVSLLLTRYVNLKGLRHTEALNFWHGRPGNHRTAARPGHREHWGATCPSFTSPSGH